MRHCFSHFILFALLVTASHQAQAEPQKKEDKKLQLSETGIDLKDLIKKAAKNTSSRCEISKEVKGKCSVLFLSITFETALDLTLPVFDARWYQKNGTYHIVTTAQYKKLFPKQAANKDKKKPKPDKPPKNGARVDASGNISLHVKDLKVEKVIKLLCIQQKAFMVITTGVQGKVTLDIKDASVSEIMEHICKPKGWRWQIKDRCIYVLTKPEWKRWQGSGKDKKSQDK